MNDTLVSTYCWAVIIHHVALLDAATVMCLLLELVVSLSGLSTFALLLSLHLAPVEELGKLISW